MSAEHRVGRRAQRNVDVPELFIGAQRAPRAHVAGVMKGIAPGVVAELPGTRPHVERPQQFSCRGIVAAHILRRRFLAGAQVSAAAAVPGDHDHVADDDRAGGFVEIPGIELFPFQRDPAEVTEVRIGSAVLGAEGVQIRAAHGKHASILAASQRVQAARALPGNALQARIDRLLYPQRLAGRAVERFDQPDGIRGIQDAVHHDRCRPEVRGRAQVGKGLRQPGFKGGTPPENLELADVVAVDLIERRISRVSLVAAEVPPFTGSRPLLRADRSGPDPGETQNQEPADQSL